MDVVYTSVLYSAPSSIFMAEVGACNYFIIIITASINYVYYWTKQWVLFWT